MAVGSGEIVGELTNEKVFEMLVKYCIDHSTPAPGQSTFKQHFAGLKKMAGLVLEKGVGSSDADIAKELAGERELADVIPPKIPKEPARVHLAKDEVAQSVVGLIRAGKWKKPNKSSKQQAASSNTASSSSSGAQKQQQKQQLRQGDEKRAKTEEGSSYAGFRSQVTDGLTFEMLESWMETGGMVASALARSKQANEARTVREAIAAATVLQGLLQPPPPPPPHGYGAEEMGEQGDDDDFVSDNGGA